MGYQFSKRHRTTFQILGVILLLLFFSAVLVPLLGASIISFLSVGAIIIIIAVIVGKRGTSTTGTKSPLADGQYPMTKTNPRPDVPCLVVLVPAIVWTVRPVHQED